MSQVRRGEEWVLGEAEEVARTPLPGEPGYDQELLIEAVAALRIALHMLEESRCLPPGKPKLEVVEP